MQIPVKEYGDISEDEKRARNAEDITKAKETIGKVVQLEFREEKRDVTEADKKERNTLAQNALSEIKSGTPFATVGTKYQDQYDNIAFVTSSGAIPEEFRFEKIDTVPLPHTTEIIYIKGQEQIGASGSTRGPGGYAIIRLDKRYDSSEITASGKVDKKEYAYSIIYVDERPSLWTPAKTADGKSLGDKYLTRAGMSLNQAGVPQVDLVFNDEGKKIFAELTKRLIGKKIAIFVGGQMLTDPTVQAVISDGRAVITGDYTIASAQKLANDINTGIVPAPIYLTSERTIDAKIGKNALSEILVAGLIGLVAIILLLVYYYRVSGLLAGIALVIYSLLLVAIIKAF